MIEKHGEVREGLTPEEVRISSGGHKKTSSKSKREDGLKDHTEKRAADRVEEKLEQIKQQSE